LGDDVIIDGAHAAPAHRSSKLQASPQQMQVRAQSKTISVSTSGRAAGGATIVLDRAGKLTVVVFGVRSTEPGGGKVGTWVE
jgi:hypothetical protein